MRQDNKSCNVHMSRPMQHATSGNDNATMDAPPCAHSGIKALAYKVLERNSVRNLDATHSKVGETFGSENRGEKLHQLRTYSAFKLHELRAVAGDDWDAIKDNPAMLSFFASALRDGTQRNMVVTPDHYTQNVHCLNCGDVKLWKGCPSVVHGCPWCLINE